jgi:hypothetical protein
MVITKWESTFVNFERVLRHIQKILLLVNLQVTKIALIRSKINAKWRNTVSGQNISKTKQDRK